MNFRSQVKSALFTLLQGVTFPDSVNGFTTWQTTSQRWKIWTQVDPSNQPAMFLTQHREEQVRRGVGQFIRVYLICQVWCYAPTGDAGSGNIGDQMLDSMETGIEAALKPGPGNYYRDEQTLGGLLGATGWVRVDKTDNMFLRDPGDMDSQALLLLPIRILLPEGVPT